MTTELERKLVDENERLLEEVEALRSLQAGEAVRHFSEQIADLQERVAAAESEAKVYNKGLAAQFQENARLKQEFELQLAAARQESQSVSDDHRSRDALAAENARLKESVASLTQRVQDMEKRIEAAGALEKEYNDRVQKTDALKSDVLNLNQRFRAANQEKQMLQQQINNSNEERDKDCNRAMNFSQKMERWVAEVQKCSIDPILTLEGTQGLEKHNAMQVRLSEITEEIKEELMKKPEGFTGIVHQPCCEMALEAAFLRERVNNSTANHVVSSKARVNADSHDSGQPGNNTPRSKKWSSFFSRK
jgi:chromosome segregation ATPase